MRCPFCGHDNTQVKDSRVIDDGSGIRRRRSCPHCSSRFTTFEHIQLRDLTVVKKSGAHVPFEREKLYRSIAIAVRKRNIDAERIEQLVNALVRQLEARAESEIRSSDIGELVMESLQALDKVAYVRYASVYKNFTRTEDFEDLAGKLVERK